MFRSFALLIAVGFAALIAAEDAVAYYHPQMGRFVSRDPIGYASGTNQYSYVGSKPTLAIDPYGLKLEIIARPDHVNDDWATYNRKARFYQEVLKALQAVVGDCAKLSLANTETITYGRSSQMFIYAEIIYSAENPDCKCNECWQELKKAIDHDTSIRIDFQGGDTGSHMNEEWEKGEEPHVFLNPSIPEAGNWEIAPGGGGVFEKPIFPAVVWHEIMGHAWPAVSTNDPNYHSTAPENFYNAGNANGDYYDPAIKIENMGRNCLRMQGFKIRDRVHQYFGYENSEGWGTWWNTGEWTAWPKPGDTRPY